MNFFLADIFLIFIFTCGDDDVINDENANFYFNELKNYLLKNDAIKFKSDIYRIMSLVINRNEVFCKRLNVFLEKYDFFYYIHIVCDRDFVFYMINGKFYKNKISAPTNSAQNINEDFYKGFYNS